MKINIFILILIDFLFVNCNGQHTNITANHEYQAALNRFPQGMVNFFPKLLSDKYSIKENFDTTNHCIYYVNCVFENKDSLPINKNDYIAKYTASDKSLVTIKPESVMYWDETKRINYSTLEMQNQRYYPILYFESDNILKNSDYNIYSDLTVCGLADNFDIYVLESKSGMYWSGLKGVNYLPDEWRNGYSKGICVDKERETIIYWVVVW